MSVCVQVFLAFLMLGIGSVLTGVFVILFIRDVRYGYFRALVAGTAAMVMLSLSMVVVAIAVLTDLINITAGGAPWLP
jgi:hypothetical protein